RRDADLDVSDRIALRLRATDDAVDAVRTHERLIAAETLSTSIDVETAEFAESEGTDVGDGAKVSVEVARA
ncbi:MAG: DUF5915 domain-containing protein, partial [Ilumatobacteraceae bacterium]